MDGDKWDLEMFWEYLSSIGKDPDVIRTRIQDIMIKSFIAAERGLYSCCQRDLKHRGTVFEVFGFDIMLDSSFKCWLIEVNVSPSLSSTSPLDARIKGCLISDVFNTVGFTPPKASVAAERGGATSGSTTPIAPIVVRRVCGVCIQRQAEAM